MLNNKQYQLLKSFSVNESEIIYQDNHLLLPFHKVIKSNIFKRYINNVNDYNDIEATLRWDYYINRKLNEKFGISDFNLLSQFRQMIEHIAKDIVHNLPVKDFEYIFPDEDYQALIYEYDFNIDWIKTVRIMLLNAPDINDALNFSAILPDPESPLLFLPKFMPYYQETNNCIDIATIIMYIDDDTIINPPVYNIVMHRLAHELKHCQTFLYHKQSTYQAEHLNAITDKIMTEYDINIDNEKNVILYNRISDINDLAFLCKECIYYTENIELKSFLENIFYEASELKQAEVLSLKTLSKSSTYKYINYILLRLTNCINNYEQFIKNFNKDDLYTLLTIIRDNNKLNKQQTYSILKSNFIKWLKALKNFQQKAINIFGEFIK